METVDASVEGIKKARATTSEISNVEVEGYKQHVDEFFQEVDKLEQKMNEVEQFYTNLSKNKQTASKGSLTLKYKDKKPWQDPACQETAPRKRTQELMRQFGTIFRQITQHKLAWPFMQPVDVEGLGLHDYYEIIEKPMDFSTIRNLMEAKDGNGYKNVWEIYADMKLVFKNAMTYNDKKSEVHFMAKTLLAKFEEKWLQLLPLVTQEEKRQEAEEAGAQLFVQQHAQEAAHAKMATDISNKLYELDMHLEELREMVVQKCRKISTEEKRKLGIVLTRLSPEDLDKALQIVSQDNPSFQPTAEEVDLDLDAQTESTLWRLKFFVKETLEGQGKGSASMGGNNTINPKNNNDNGSNNMKRKRELCHAITKTAKRKNKIPPC